MTQETQTGTLEELNVKPGDVVEFVGGETTGFIIGKHYECVTGKDGLGRPAIGPVNGVGGCIPMSYANLTWRIVSRVTPPLQIEAGKYYKTRDGRKVYVDTKGSSCYGGDSFFTGCGYSILPSGREYRDEMSPRDLIAEWTATPPTWGEMTDAEKGALLLARHEGGVVESSRNGTGWALDSRVGYCGDVYYRIKPEPLVETVTLYGSYNGGQWVFSPFNDGIHSVVQTFTTTNGEPDLDSIKMERING